MAHHLLAGDLKSVSSVKVAIIKIFLLIAEKFLS